MLGFPHVLKEFIRVLLELPRKGVQIQGATYVIVEHPEGGRPDLFASLHELFREARVEKTSRSIWLRAFAHY